MSQTATDAQARAEQLQQHASRTVRSLSLSLSLACSRYSLPEQKPYGSLAALQTGSLVRRPSSSPADPAPCAESCETAKRRGNDKNVYDHTSGFYRRWRSHGLWAIGHAVVSPLTLPQVNQQEFPGLFSAKSTLIFEEPILSCRMQVYLQPPHQPLTGSRRSPERRMARSTQVVSENSIWQKSVPLRLLLSLGKLFRPPVHTAHATLKPNAAA